MNKPKKQRYWRCCHGCGCFYYADSKYSKSCDECAKKHREEGYKKRFGPDYKTKSKHL